MKRANCSATATRLSSSPEIDSTLPAAASGDPHTHIKEDAVFWAKMLLVAAVAWAVLHGSDFVSKYSGGDSEPAAGKECELWTGTPGEPDYYCFG